MTIYEITGTERRRNTAARAERYCRTNNINSRSRRRARQRYTFTGNIATSVLFLVMLVIVAYEMAGGW